MGKAVQVTEFGKTIHSVHFISSVVLLILVADFMREFYSQMDAYLSGSLECSSQLHSCALKPA